MSESKRIVVRFSEKVLNWTYGLVKWSFDINREKKNWQWAITFCPMSQNDKKQIFPKFCLLKKTFLWADRMQFWQPNWFFWGNAKNFCSISDADKTERIRNDTFLKKCSFQRLFFKSRRLQSSQTIQKVYDKEGQLFSLKVQKSKVLKKQFLQKSFFLHQRFLSRK